MTNKSPDYSGIGLIGLLAVVFVVLKLLGYIDWSWWWVLSPLWITVLFIIWAIIVLCGIWIFSNLLEN